jgi:hypothetical protein
MDDDDDFDSALAASLYADMQSRIAAQEQVLRVIVGAMERFNPGARDMIKRSVMDLARQATRADKDLAAELQDLSQKL